jgi:DNA-binding MarR family transcriptional regulator
MSIVTQSREEHIQRIHDTFMLLMRLSKRWFVQRLQSYGLTLPQFMTLAALAAHEEACTMSDLTNVTFHDPPTMTGVIDRLVKTKLVQRTRSETDRRVVLVKATPTGIDLTNEIKESLMQETLTSYKMLTDEELVTLEQLLRRLLRMHLGQYTSLQDVDAEIEKLEHFTKDPINYMKLVNTKAI